MVIEFRKPSPHRAMNGAAIELVDSYKYLWVILVIALSFESHFATTLKKNVQQRLYFFKEIESF